MYVKFQTFDKRNQGDRHTDSDVLVEEILDFYLGQNYTKNVVGLIVKLASDALGINIYIFQNSDGQILRVRSLGDLACKDVFVKFTHNPIHNLGNHYDAILMKPDFQNLDLLLNAAVSEIIEPKSVNKKPPPAHHQSPPSTQFQSPSLPNASLPEEYDSQPLDLSTKNTPTVSKGQTPLKDVEDEIPVVEDGNGVHEDEIPVVEDWNGVHEDKIPVVEDGNGVHEDEIPVVEDENIVVIDGVHEDEDDDFKTPYCPRNLRTPEHQHKNSEDGKIPKIGRGNYFPTHLFENEHIEVVEHIPKYIDGFKKYLIETNNYVKDTRDLRYFVMSTSSKVDYKGIRKVGTCHGSWECQNSHCRFLDTSVDKQPNRIDWITVKRKKISKYVQSVSTL